MAGLKMAEQDARERMTRMTTGEIMREKTTNHRNLVKVAKATEKPVKLQETLEILRAAMVPH